MSICYKVLWWVYCKIWYHFQFFVENKYLRRPFTFWMRDCQIRWPYLFWPVTGGIFYGLYVLTQSHNIIGFLLSGFCWMLFGHLNWGTTIIEGQQEHPEYVED